MNKICVITGAGSGIGTAVAKEVCKAGYQVVLAGRTLAKLEAVADELIAKGYEAKAIKCEISDKSSVEHLAEGVKELGKVTAVIHAAGVSPNMGTPNEIMEINALGTIYIHEAFVNIIEPGGCLIDTSSMAAHMLPSFARPRFLYRLSKKDCALFQRRIMALVNLIPNKVRTGLSYALSKDFVIWLAKKEARRFGERGIRILSVSPGNFDTPMGNLEKDNGGEAFMKYNAVKRFGKPEEIARLYTALIDESLGYLSGTDILCDGGAMAGRMK